MNVGPPEAANGCRRSRRTSRATSSPASCPPSARSWPTSATWPWWSSTGYVDLDGTGRPGLGAHLHAAIQVPVVGVAKTAFRGATHAIPVHRGEATRPLYVTAAGLPTASAAALVAAMAGPHRMPDALRRVDTLARA